jgi:unsaturated chondroitin disaccharide hydrolase
MRRLAGLWLVLAGCSALRSPPPSQKLTAGGDRVAAPAPSPALVAQLEQAIAFAESQTENLYRRLPDLEKAQDEAYPEAVLVGQTKYRMLNAAHWGAGFFPATLWALYELTGRADWKRRAESKTLGLWGEVVWDYSSNIGYKMIPFREALRLTGDPTFLSFMLRGAETYTRGFGAELCVGSIPTWNPGSRRVKGAPLMHAVHTGGLMNIELLFWAAEQPGGNRQWFDIAHRHAQNAVRDQIRPDGAAYHIVDYHPGCPPRGWRWRGTDSGDPEGIKARPQALAIYGLTTAYEHTKDRALLEAAVRAAAFFIAPAHAPADGVPYTDILLGPVSDQPRESSAAAIAASALLELSTLPAVGAPDRQRFRAAAEGLLGALATRYLARNQTEGILGRGPDRMDPNAVPTSSPPIGDYAFLDAIRKYLGPGVHCRATRCELEAEAGHLSGARLDTGPPLAVASTAGQAVTELTVRLPRAGRFRFSARLDVPGKPATLGVRFGSRDQRTWTVSPTRGFQDVHMAEEIALGTGAHTLAVTGIPAGVRVDKLVLERLP